MRMCIVALTASLGLAKLHKSLHDVLWISIGYHFIHLPPVGIHIIVYVKCVYWAMTCTTYFDALLRDNMGFSSQKQIFWLELFDYTSVVLSIIVAIRP